MWEDGTSGDVFRVKSRDPVLYITNGTKVNIVVGDSRGVSKLSQQQQTIYLPLEPLTRGVQKVVRTRF